MSKEMFIKDWLTNVKMRIHNRAECILFQRIAFDMGINNFMGEKCYISFNICDNYPENKGKSYAVDMTNLTINDKRGIQMSAFFNLEELKEIFFDDFIIAYQKMIITEELKASTTPFD